MKIAIVGSGIAGLATAWLLAQDHEITVFEADSRVGGHTHTHAVANGAGTVAVDTGFIVFNERTYPNFVKLLRKLGVAWQRSDMSFAVSDERSGIEWNGATLNSLFAQRRNLLRPSFLRMVKDVLRFNREATDYARSADAALSMRAFVERGRYGSEFVRLYLAPMTAAIWSMSDDAVLEFPFRTFATFFLNHGMLSVDERPQWLAIRGGSRQYVDALIAPFRERIRLNAAVHDVRRFDTHVEIVADGGAERFDAIVLACHSDRSLALLADASAEEREILGALPFQRSAAVLHTDASVLPRTRRAWASWNYHAGAAPTARASGATLTYWMNRLQSLAGPTNWCVTLNPARRIREDAVLARMNYEHPVMTAGADVGRSRIAEIDGVRRTYYAGAYWGFGFHEDGVNSALRVARHFGKTW